MITVKTDKVKEKTEIQKAREFAEKAKREKAKREKAAREKAARERRPQSAHLVVVVDSDGFIEVYSDQSNVCAIVINRPEAISDRNAILVEELLLEVVPYPYRKALAWPGNRVTIGQQKKVTVDDIWLNLYRLRVIEDGKPTPANQKMFAILGGSRSGYVNQCPYESRIASEGLPEGAA